MAAKSKEHKLITEAIRKQLPVVKDMVTPAAAFAGGAGAGAAGKYLYDRYNKEDNF